MSRVSISAVFINNLNIRDKPVGRISLKRPIVRVSSRRSGSSMLCLRAILNKVHKSSHAECTFNVPMTLIYIIADGGVQ